MNGVVRSALALALLASATVACSGGEPARPSASPAAATSAVRSPGVSPSPRPPAVTLEEAGRALDAFLDTNEVVRTAQADRWTLSLTRDGQRPITIAEIHSHSGEPVHYTWSDRRVLVPRQSGSTQWFAATAERRDSSGHVRTAVLTFVRQGRDGRWQNSFASLLYPGGRPPEVALDGEGYATALESRDSSVAISPNLMGPLHATVAEEGPKGYASGLIAPGPQTTGFFDAISEAKEEAKAVDCMNYESIFASAPNYPTFALRTRDGGAMLMYTLVRTSSWSPTPQGLKCGEGRFVPVPAAARWLLSSPANLKISQKRQIIETQQYVSAVPPKASTAPAHVVGYEGIVTGATNR